MERTEQIEKVLRLYEKMDKSQLLYYKALHKHFVRKYGRQCHKFMIKYGKDKSITILFYNKVMEQKKRIAIINSILASR